MRAEEAQALFEYSCAATAIILGAASRLAPNECVAQPAQVGADSLQHILVHMLDTEMGWRENLIAQRRNATPELDIADFPNVKRLASAWRADEQRTHDWLATLDDTAVNAR